MNDKFSATFAYSLKAANNKPWFSPAYVLAEYVRLLKMVGSEKIEKEEKYKQIREMKAVALFLLGVMQGADKEYWLQPVLDEGTPDVRTFCFDQTEEGVVEQVFQEVEVVTYNEHSEENIIDFIKRTKLDKSSYPEYFVILCDIRKNYKLPSPKEMHSELKKINPSLTIALIGRTHPTKETYRALKIYPEIGFVEDFNALELSVSYHKKLKTENRHHTLILKRVPKTRKLNLTSLKEVHHPFESILTKQELDELKKITKL